MHRRASSHEDNLLRFLYAYCLTWGNLRKASLTRRTFSSGRLPQVASSYVEKKMINDSFAL